MEMNFTKIPGVGLYLPEKILTNFDLEKRTYHDQETGEELRTSVEWITQRTGVNERRIASPEDTHRNMGTQALEGALAQSGTKPDELDMIVVATCTYLEGFPCVAGQIQDAFNLRDIPVFDIEAGCSGFVYALAIADALFAKMPYQKAAIVVPERLTDVTNWDDRSTCILFGDGCGAAVLERSSEPGIINSFLSGRGSGAKYLSSIRENKNLGVAYDGPLLQMDGREVFKFAVEALPISIEKVLEGTGYSLDDVELIVPHQANYRIIDASARRLGIPPEKFYMNVDVYGNFSAATVPVALCEAIDKGLIKNNDLYLLVGFGAGLTYGATLVRHLENANP